MKEVTPSIVAEADCNLLNDIESDLTVGASTVPNAIRTGDWFMLEIVSAHEQLHVTHVSDAATRFHNELIRDLDTIATPTQLEAESRAQAAIDRANGALGQAKTDDGNHVPVQPFIDTQVQAATPMLGEIARRKAKECSTIDLHGTWNGVMIEGNDREPVRVVLAQSGNNVEGTLDTALFSGTLRGTLRGTTLSVIADVPPDKIKLGPKCAIHTEGLAENVTSTFIAGNYAGRNACTGSFTGRFELRR